MVETLLFFLAKVMSMRCEGKSVGEVQERVSCLEREMEEEKALSPLRPSFPLLDSVLWGMRANFSLLKTLARRPHGPQRGWTSAQKPLSCWVSQSWAQIQASCHVRCFHTFITQELVYWLVLLSVTCSSKHAHWYKWYKDHTLISPAACLQAHTHITFFLLTLYSILLEPKTLLPLLTEWETDSETDVFYHMELWGHMLWVAEPLSVAWQIESNLTCAYLQAMTLSSQETLVLPRSLRSRDD